MLVVGRVQQANPFLPLLPSWVCLAVSRTSNSPGPSPKNKLLIQQEPVHDEFLPPLAAFTLSPHGFTMIDLLFIEPSLGFVCKEQKREGLCCAIANLHITAVHSFQRTSPTAALWKHWWKTQRALGFSKRRSVLSRDTMTNLLSAHT
jgi:hypothetical protein